MRNMFHDVLNYKKPAFWIICVSAVVLLVLAICFLTGPKDDEHKLPEDESSVTSVTDSEHLDVEKTEDRQPDDNPVEKETVSEETEEGWTFLEGNGGWHQRITDEHIKNAGYLFDQGIDNALEAHCVLLYRDEARDFSLYYSFKSYQFDDYEDLLIVSNGRKTVVKGLGAWERVDLREVVSASDLDNDGFEEIIAPVTTGYGTGFFRSSFFVFDSSDGITYDMLSVCGAEEIICSEEDYEIKYLQDISAQIDVTDGSLIFMQGNEIKYEGHIKGLLAINPDIDKVRWADSVSAVLTNDGKPVLVSNPCFWSDTFVGGTYVEPHDTDNDVCDIIYEIEYHKDGTFECAAVDFINQVKFFSGEAHTR